MAGLGGLAALFNRPKTEFADKEGEEFSITPKPSDLIYIRKCKQCTFKVNGKAAKCIIESSTDVKVELEDYLISGTLEMIDCQSVTVSINPQDPLPTLSAERSHDIHLYYYEPRAFGSLYTVDCTDFTVHLQPPHTEVNKLTLPTDDKTGQYVTEMRGNKFMLDKVIREGCGHATTAEKQRIAILKEKQMQRQMENYLNRIITIHPKGSKRGAKPLPTGPPAAKSQPPGPKPSGEGAPKSSQGVPKPPKEPEVPKQVATATSTQSSGGSATPLADPAENPLAAAIQSKRKDLKPTETVERSLPVVGVDVERPSGGSNRYNIEDKESKKEYFDSAEELEKKVDKVVQWVKNSKHPIFFTGAGISTSAGIPDFRSGMDTVLKTGPGVWELNAHRSRGREGSETKPLLQALPTPTHMGIVKLQEAGVCKFTVSQNVDGLHRRSGLGPKQLAELHGNTNLETCSKCERQYLRDFQTREARDVFDHRTSRDCVHPKCKGYLKDSIINFGENLPAKELEAAFQHAGVSDLCIMLGSSLRVRPACQVPEVVRGHGGKVVICNLQKIPQFPADNRTLQVFAKCDDFMTALLTKLGLEIPAFALKRRVRIALSNNDGVKITVTGLDRDEDLPYSFIKCVTTEMTGQKYSANKEPLVLNLPPPTSDDAELPITMYFHGHYGEPPVTVHRSVRSDTAVFSMSYNPLNGKWTVSGE